MRVLSILLSCLVSTALASVGFAEPMDLIDAHARPVLVQFELLDTDTAEAAEEEFSEPFLAQLRPASEAEQFTVTVPGPVVEKLMSSQNAEPGSFSEFVWTFNRVTGEVLSAAVSGILNQQINLGLFKTKVDAKIQIQMDTLVPAGKGKPRNLMGHILAKFCNDADDEDCQIVDPVDYDTGTGFVHAVGSLLAKTSFITTRTMAPFGKAIFTEVPKDLVSAAKSAVFPSVEAGELP